MEQTFVRNLFVRHRAIRGAMYLVKNYNTYAVNSVGEKIWEALDEHGTIISLVDSLTSDYPDVPLEKLRDDVTLFINALLQAGLIEKTTP